MRWERTTVNLCGVRGCTSDRRGACDGLRLPGHYVVSMAVVIAMAVVMVVVVVITMLVVMVMLVLIIAMAAMATLLFLPA